MRKIGIMGGTFNPVHIGHLLLAECAREEYSLEEVWFIPTGFSYHKAVGDGLLPECRIPSSKERLEMTRLAVAENPYFKCLDLEVNRKGDTYTYETLDILNHMYEDTEFYFILGADCLYDIPNWKMAERIFAACKIIAALRESYDAGDIRIQIEKLKKAYSADILFLPFQEFAFSSTDIRKRVSRHKSIRYMVPEQVNNYIEEKGFYQI